MTTDRLSPDNQAESTPQSSCGCHDPACEHTVAETAISAAASSLLDPVETAVDLYASDSLPPYDQPQPEYQIEPLTTVEETFRHSGWKRLRASIFQALIDCHASATRMECFACCGSGARILYNPQTKELRVQANLCHDRFCIPCGTSRARIIAASLAAGCKGKCVRFATLTLKHSRASLPAQIDRLYDSFRRLRQRKSWRATVTGGAAFLELKIGKDRLWHPHLHCLVETKWLDQKTLAHEWYEVTGDSFIVDVRPIRSEKELVNYVAKYASKPMEATTLRDHSRLCELIPALRSRRLCLAFGTWKRIVLEPECTDADAWIVLGRLQDCVHDARAGDKDAIALIEALTRRHRLLTPPPTTQ